MEGVFVIGGDAKVPTVHEKQSTFGADLRLCEAMVDGQAISDRLLRGRTSARPSESLGGVRIESEMIGGGQRSPHTPQTGRWTRLTLLMVGIVEPDVDVSEDDGRESDVGHDGRHLLFGHGGW